MLLRVLIKNFLSFDEEVMFDMFPNLKRTSLSFHVYASPGSVPLLKQAAVFGPNGAGKSNLVKAIDFIKSFALNRDFIKNIEIGKYFFKLKPDNSAPIYLAIEFEFEGKYYFYEIEILKTTVKRETLYETYPFHNQKDLIFERKKSKIAFAPGVKIDEAIQIATEKMLEKNKLSSLISLNKEFPILSDDRIKAVNKWLRAYLEIIGVHSRIPDFIDLLRRDANLLRFAKNAVSKLELGVSDFDVTDEDFDNWAQNHDNIAKHIPWSQEEEIALSLNENETPIFLFNKENGIRKVYQLLFENIGKNGYIGKLDARL